MSPFPTMAPSDSGSPPTSGTMRTLRRLSSEFRPPPVVPCQPIPCGVPVFCVVCGLRDTSPLTTGRIGHPALPYCLTGKYQQGVDRPPRFLNQPCVHMPRSKTPAGSTTPPSLSTTECCLPHKCKASASHNSTTFQDSMTQPAYLLLLCFTVILTASRAEFATSLLTGFGWVGIAPTG